jgi:hypothetical protein
MIDANIMSDTAIIIMSDTNIMSDTDVNDAALHALHE